MTLEQEIQRLLEGRHHDPFALLGRHPTADGWLIRAWLPGADEACIVDADRELPMAPLSTGGLFQWQGSEPPLGPYRIRWRRGGKRFEQYDPYAFPPQLGNFDLHLFSAGNHRHAYRFLGARLHDVEGIAGVLFAIWAPNAERVSVVGDFNAWDGRRHPMRSRGTSGVWELFIPQLDAGALYKFELRSREGRVFLKSDPYGRRFELRPANAALVEHSDYQWCDQAWLAQRAGYDWDHAALSIYELHLGSWDKDENFHFLDYRTLADRLVPYVREMGYTHIELMPITEHPLDASWGYQVSGYFAPTSRFGDADGLRYLIDLCHQNGLGVILDWVPAHFPRDEHALARFDGSPLYEHADPRRGEHRDWGTLIFNYGRNEVRNFLIASAVYWLEEFHIDGLRVDAVASMLYLDYSRPDGAWLPNVHGGREHLEAIDFLREFNSVIHELFPGVLTMAEESTAWPGVSRPAQQGGLGFSMKWNMGWMNDNLDYMHRDPLYRKHHHNQLTFGLLYAYSEKFILPFSHDEVVHLKRSMLEKMPGDDWQRFANLRLLYTWQYSMPGKKLLFMGSEMAQRHEWDWDRPLDWTLLDSPPHRGVHDTVRELNHLYRDHSALHYHDFDPAGFQWLDCDDAAHSVISFLRRSGSETLVVILNFTPEVRQGYRIGLPEGGVYGPLFNSDDERFGGGGVGTGAVSAEALPWADQPWSGTLTLPPLAGIILQRQNQ